MPAKLKKILKGLLYTLCGIIAFMLLVLTIPIIFGLFTSDPPIDDGDLSLYKITISKADNAYYDMKKIEDILDKSKEVKDDSTLLDKHLTGKTWDEEFVKEILARNQEILTHFSTAATKPKYQLPQLADPGKVESFYEMEVPSFLLYRKITRLSAVKALKLAKGGKTVDALDQALISVKIGQLIQNSQLHLISHMTAIMMKAIGLNAIQQIIASADLPSERLKELIKQLNGFYDNETGMATSFKVEYQAFAQIMPPKFQLADLRSNKEKFVLSFLVLYKFHYQPNKTKSIAADYYREIIKNIYRPWNEFEDIKSEFFYFPDSYKFIFTENCIGKILVSIGMPSFKSYIKRNFDEDLMVSATQTLAALKAYKNDNGRLPASLNALVPDYIEAVPTDPFDAKPIKYSATKKIIYSVGDDSTDSGGSEGENWKDMEDPTFSIDF